MQSEATCSIQTIVPIVQSADLQKNEKVKKCYLVTKKSNMCNRVSNFPLIYPTQILASMWNDSITLKKTRFRTTFFLSINFTYVFFSFMK